MKKTLLKTRGYFLQGVFIVNKIYVPEGCVNEKDEPVKEGWGKYTQKDALCGGKEKPPAKDDEGDWFCVDDEWVWFPG